MSDKKLDKKRHIRAGNVIGLSLYFLIILTLGTNSNNGNAF